MCPMKFLSGSPAAAAPGGRRASADSPSGATVSVPTPRSSDAGLKVKRISRSGSSGEPDAGEAKQLGWSVSGKVSQDTTVVEGEAEEGEDEEDEEEEEEEEEEAGCPSGSARRRFDVIVSSSCMLMCRCSLSILSRVSHATCSVQYTVWSSAS